MLVYIVLPIAAIAIALAVGLPDKYISSLAHRVLAGGDLGRAADARPAGEGVRRPVRREPAPTRCSPRINLKRQLKQPGRADTAAGRRAARTSIDTIDGDTDVQTVRVPVLDPDTGREREIVSAFTVGFTSRDPETAHRRGGMAHDGVPAGEPRHLCASAPASSAQFYTAEADRYSKQIGVLEVQARRLQGEELRPAARAARREPERHGSQRARPARPSRSRSANLRQNRMFYACSSSRRRRTAPMPTCSQQLEGEYARKRAIYDPDHPDLINLRRQIDSLRRGGPAMSDMSLPQQLEAQKAILSETRQRYSADHPDVKRVQRTIEELRGAHRARREGGFDGPVAAPTVMQIKAQINGVDTQIAGLETRGRELRVKMDQLVKRVEATPQVEREYQQLTRDLELARTKYDELLKSRMDSELTAAAIAGGRSDEIRIVTPPARALGAGEACAAADRGGGHRTCAGSGVGRRRAHGSDGPDGARQP